MTRFIGIPSVPFEMDNTTVRILLALKENVELLTGQRGESDGASAAITSGSLTVNQVSGDFRGLSARATGATVGNVDVPLLEDYTKALRDMQQLAIDVAALRDTVNQLIKQLRS